MTKNVDDDPFQFWMRRQLDSVFDDILRTQTQIKGQRAMLEDNMEKLNKLERIRDFFLEHYEGEYP